MLAQALLPGPATKLLGERNAVLIGIACVCTALVVLAFARQGWIVFAIMPIFVLGGIGTPAFQALATRQIDPDRQGQFQGVLASAVSLASIIGPLLFSTLYFVMQKQCPGAIWLAVVAIYAIAVPLVILGTRTAHPASRNSAPVPSASAAI
jgi:MFS transporter, DHA1 family, tetracycline resistance protein